MLRSLWTGATGMIAQQTNIDVIANNLSNVNTAGYKTQVNEFKSLLYQEIQTKTTTANGENKPVGAQVGLGVRNASVTTVFKDGPLLASDKDSAFAISGDGLFGIRSSDGNTYYTRNGNFEWTTAANGGIMLSTSDGLPVLSNTGAPIVLNANYTTSKIQVTEDGEICYPDAEDNLQYLGISIGVFQFTNPAGLEKVDSTLYRQTAASGAVINEAANNNIKKSAISQGFLEGSGVQVVDEMVSMIVAQRAYEMNSKAITASDEMLQQANNLRR